MVILCKLMLWRYSVNKKLLLPTRFRGFSPAPQNKW